MQTLTPEQFAELERTNPQLAAQIMAGVGNSNSGGSGSGWGALLGSDGMPMRVSSDAANTSARMQPKSGKQDRGVPSDAQQPPRRPKSLGPSRVADDAPQTSGKDVEGDTARTNARGASKQQPSTDEASSTTQTLPPRRPADLTQSPPSVTTPQRIAQEIFGPRGDEYMPPLPDDVAASAANATAGSQGEPVDGVTGITADDIAADPSLQGASAGMQRSGGSWRDMIGAVTGALSGRNGLMQALQQQGIDFNTLSTQDRVRAATMGAQKFAAQYKSQQRQAPTRQQAQR